MKILNNKYSKWYYNLLESRSKLSRVKSKGEYFESHHITPKSLGGSDDLDNLVLLTPREHYIAHLLLPYFTIGYDRIKMLTAFNFMSSKANHKINSKLYETLKTQYRNEVKGKNHPKYGYNVSQETKKKLSIAASKYSGINSPLYGKPKSDSHKKNMSKNHANFKGKNHPQYGTKKSKETINRMSKPRKNKQNMFGKQEKVKCPHCDKEGGKNLMYRYHFDKCKNLV